jgi:hypothetical protein
MALIFRGKSTCSLCGLVLETDQDIVGLAHVLTPDHPLWRFSDSAVHESCYQHWQHREYFESVVRKNREIWNSRPARLQLKANEIETLSKEEQTRFWAEVDGWGKKTAEGTKEFIESLGAL